MIVCFVDIGGIVDHHCLNFLFIMYIRKLNSLFFLEIVKIVINSTLVRYK
jgi:hypothetical protein